LTGSLPYNGTFYAFERFFWFIRLSGLPLWFRIEKDGVLVDSPWLWKFSAIVKGGRHFLAMRTTRKKRVSLRTISFVGALLLSAVILRNRPNQTNLACLLISIFMVVQF
jgi:hypothetical protein